jgi:Putative Actinobacterial Holin-X, holin superfamily III
MLVGVAAVLSLAGLIVLLLAAVRWLEIAGLPQEWGLLLVGGTAVIIGIALAFVGANRLRAPALTPDRTISQLRADISVAKEHAA